MKYIFILQHRWVHVMRNSDKFVQQVSELISCNICYQLV